MIPDGFDAATLERVTGGNKRLSRELVDMLLKELPTHRQRILAAVHDDDRALLGRYCHTLAGAAAYCGAVELRRCCTTLEDSLLVATDAPITKLLVAPVLQEIERLLGSSP